MMPREGDLVEFGKSPNRHVGVVETVFGGSQPPFLLTPRADVLTVNQHVWGFIRATQGSVSYYYRGTVTNTARKTVIVKWADNSKEQRLSRTRVFVADEPLSNVGVDVKTEESEFALNAVVTEQRGETFVVQQTTPFGSLGAAERNVLLRDAAFPHTPYCKVKENDTGKSFTVPVNWLLNVSQLPRKSRRTPKAVNPTAQAKRRKSAYPYKQYLKFNDIYRPDKNLLTPAYKKRVKKFGMKRVLDPGLLKQEAGQQGVTNVELKRIVNKNNSWGVVATKKIMKNNVVAYYIAQNVPETEELEKLVNGGMYTIISDCKTCISDITIDSVPPVTKAKVPFWGHFLNEPSVGEVSNCVLETVYTSKKEGSYVLFALVTDENVNIGDELTWCYGDGYETLRKNYHTSCSSAASSSSSSSAASFSGAGYGIVTLKTPPVRGAYVFAPQYDPRVKGGFEKSVWQLARVRQASKSQPEKMIVDTGSVDKVVRLTIDYKLLGNLVSYATGNVVPPYRVLFRGPESTETMLLYFGDDKEPSDKTKVLARSLKTPYPISLHFLHIFKVRPSDLCNVQDEQGEDFVTERPVAKDALARKVVWDRHMSKLWAPARHTVVKSFTRYTAAPDNGDVVWIPRNKIRKLWRRELKRTLVGSEDKRTMIAATVTGVNGDSIVVSVTSVVGNVVEFKWRKHVFQMVPGGALLAVVAEDAEDDGKMGEYPMKTLIMGRDTDAKKLMVLDFDKSAKLLESDSEELVAFNWPVEPHNAHGVRLWLPRDPEPPIVGYVQDTLDEIDDELWRFATRDATAHVVATPTGFRMST